jgi:hypothetical protein
MENNKSWNGGIWPNLFHTLKSCESTGILSQNKGTSVLLRGVTVRPYFDPPYIIYRAVYVPSENSRLPLSVSCHVRLAPA